MASMFDEFMKDIPSKPVVTIEDWSVKELLNFDDTLASLESSANNNASQLSMCAMVIAIFDHDLAKDFGDLSIATERMSMRLKNKRDQLRLLIEQKSS